MTVSNQNVSTLHVSDAVQTVFSFDFHIQGVDVTDWVPQIEVKENNVVTTKTYVISLVTEAGGTITFAVAPDDGVLAIIRSKPTDQEASYPVTQAFPSKSVEASLDDLTLQSQDTKATAEQGMRQNNGEPARNMVLPSIENRALRFAYFDDAGNVVASDILAVNVDIELGTAIFDNANSAIVTFQVQRNDAEYNITLSANSNHDFYWENKTTTGFTITSDAFVAIAQVDWMAIG